MTFRFLPPEESFLGSVCSSLFVTRATLSDYHSAVTFNLHAPALHSGSFRAHPSVPSGQASVIPSVLAPPAPVRAASAPGRCWPSPTMDASGVQGAHLAGVGAGGINQLGGGSPANPLSPRLQPLPGGRVLSNLMAEGDCGPLALCPQSGQRDRVLQAAQGKGT